MKTKWWLQAVSAGAAVLTEGHFWKLLSANLARGTLKTGNLVLMWASLCALGAASERNRIKCVAHMESIEDSTEDAQARV